METKHYKLLCVGDFTPERFSEFRGHGLDAILSFEPQSSPEDALRTLCIINYDAVLMHQSLRMSPDKFKAAIRSTHPFMVTLVPPRLPADAIFKDLIQQIDDSRIKRASYLVAGDIAFNPKTGEILTQNREFKLTNINACRLLSYMMQHPNSSLNRDNIHKYLEFADKLTSNYIDTLVRDIRTALQQSRKVRVQTVRGIGYALEVD